MELKSFKTYLKEKNEVNEAFPLLAAIPALLGKLTALVGGRAALARGAASLATTAISNAGSNQSSATQEQPSTVMASDQPQPAITLRNPTGGQPPIPGRDPSTGRSMGDAEHRGSNYIKNFTGTTSKATQAPFLGLNISLRGR